MNCFWDCWCCGYPCIHRIQILSVKPCIFSEGCYARRFLPMCVLSSVWSLPFILCLREHFILSLFLVSCRLRLGWEHSLLLLFCLRLKREQCLSVVRGKELPGTPRLPRVYKTFWIQVLMFPSQSCSLFLAARGLHLSPKHSTVGLCFSPSNVRLLSMGEKERMRVVLLLPLQDGCSSPCLSTSVLRILACFHSLSPEHKMEKRYRECWKFSLCLWLSGFSKALWPSLSVQ